jgi:hypothetical protein
VAERRSAGRSSGKILSQSSGGRSSWYKLDCLGGSVVISGYNSLKQGSSGR